MTERLNHESRDLSKVGRTRLNLILELADEAGNVDLCECEPAPSTRVLRVIRRIVTAPPQPEDRSYQVQYAHACGYRD
jgi:hypothetical protein